MKFVSRTSEIGLTDHKAQIILLDKTKRVKNIRKQSVFRIDDISNVSSFLKSINTNHFLLLSHSKLSYDELTTTFVHIFKSLISFNSVKVDIHKDVSPVKWYSSNRKNLRNILLPLKTVCADSNNKNSWQTFKAFILFLQNKIIEEKSQSLVLTL